MKTKKRPVFGSVGRQNPKVKPRAQGARRGVGRQMRYRGIAEDSRKVGVIGGMVKHTPSPVEGANKGMSCMYV